MDFMDLFASGYLLWGVFLVIAVVFLLTSFQKYRRSGSKADLPRVLTDAMATGMVVVAALHLGLGVPAPIPLVAVYVLILAGAFLYRMKAVREAHEENLKEREVIAADNRARKADAADPAREPDPS